MKADFTIIRRGARPLIPLLATLSYSQTLFVRFTNKEDTQALIDCSRQAFDYFGGVTRHVLFDNAKSVIIKRDRDGVGQQQWNAQLLKLSVQDGFSLRVC